MFTDSSKLIFHFKRLLGIILLLSMTTYAHAQVWVYVEHEGISAGQIDYPDIVVDGNGTPYIAYEDLANDQKVTVMKYYNHSWAAVGSPGISAGWSEDISIAIDGNGVPYVAYKDYANNGGATVMKFNGSSWSVVGNVNFAGAIDIDIAIAGDGTPYTVSETNQGVVVNKFNGSNWVTLGDTVSDGGGGISIAIYNNQPYVTYSEGYNTSVKKYDGTNWTLVGSRGFAAGQTTRNSLVIDGNGTPYVSFKDQANAYKATVEKFNGSNWVTVGNAGLSATGVETTSMSIGPNNTPYVAHDNSVNQSITVQKYTGGSWETVGNATLGDEVTIPSLAITNNGTPYVAFEDIGSNYEASIMTLGLPPILGGDSVCSGHSITLTDTVAGGSWSSSNTSVATVNNSGLVSATGVGTTIISYTLSDFSVYDTLKVKDCTTEINNIANASVVGTISLFPNPNNGDFTINVAGNDGESAKILITDIIGKLVQKLTIPIGKNVPLRINATPGIYFVTAATQYKKQVLKVVVN